MTLPTNRKFGRQPTRHDARTLHLVEYLHPKLPDPPPARDYCSAVTDWPMYGNDAAGDCTMADAGHQIQSWTTYGQGATVTIPEVDVIAAYSAVSGYDPDTGANDNGCNELDVLNYWRRHGIGGHKIAAYAKVDVHNHREIKQAISIFGGLYSGMAVSQSAMDQNQAGEVWDRSRTRAGRSILGAHAVPLLAYDDDGLDAVTWAMRQRMTWAFLDDYFEELYAIVTQDFLDQRTGKDPDGLDLKAMMADLHLVSA